MRRDLYEPDHEAFREVVQAYVKREVTPNQPRWEQEHIVDRQAWLAAGKCFRPIWYWPGRGRSRCVVATGRRFAGAGKAGMGGRVGRDRTGPAIRPGGLTG